jgi:hypothetical protein
MQNLFMGAHAVLRALTLLLPLAASTCGTGEQGSGSASTLTSGPATTTGTSTGGAHQPSSEDLYDAAIKTILIEVDYATGAPPYTGEILLFGDTWGLFRTNAERLFLAAGKTLEIPTELAQMEELTDINATEFNVQAILDIAAAHRDKPSSGDAASFYFVWLPGYYHDGEVLRKDVLGVSLGDTGVIAMFKPVIESTGVGPGVDIEKYVEQATLVHEFGHAIGLVNNGLPLTAQHQDEPHGAHCTNQDCVMYYAIEGTAGAIEFAGKFVKGQDSILFAGDCLADVDAAIQKGIAP